VPPLAPPPALALAGAAFPELAALIGAVAPPPPLAVAASALRASPPQAALIHANSSSESASRRASCLVSIDPIGVPRSACTLDE
jgi:hypothetical protein